MVSLQPPALESSLFLLLLVQPLAQLAGSGRSSNRSPGIPRLRRQPQPPPRTGASSAGWTPAAGSALSAPDSDWAEDSECGGGAGRGSGDRVPLHVTTASPTPEGGAAEL